MKLPQLFLRELFLIVALVAMGCGWWVDRSVLSQSSRSAKHFEQIANELCNAVDAMGGKAVYWYDERGDEHGVQVVPPLPPIEIDSTSNAHSAEDKVNSVAPLPQIEPLPSP